MLAWFFDSWRKPVGFGVFGFWCVSFPVLWIRLVSWWLYPPSQPAFAAPAVALHLGPLGRPPFSSGRPCRISHLGLKLSLGWLWCCFNWDFWHVQSSRMWNLLKDLSWTVLALLNKSGICMYLWCISDNLKSHETETQYQAQHETSLYAPILDLKSNYVKILVVSTCFYENSPRNFPIKARSRRGLGLRGGPPLGRLHGGWEATWTQHLGMVMDGDGNVMEMLWMGLPMVEMLWMINDG